MAGYGEAGVSHLIETLRYKIEDNMRLLDVWRLEDWMNHLLITKTLACGIIVSISAHLFKFLMLELFMPI